jgi:DNA-binding winged helix-turn-helix (wHTH) protein
VSTQKLIIYKFKSLYHILEELNLDLNFKMIFVDNENTLNNEVKNFNYYLIISKKLFSDIENQFVLNNTPINIFQLIENVNVEFLKIQFNSQSEIKINDYIINLNSRELIMKNIKLRLTEKEINTIIYLSRSVKPVSIDELQEKVWSYQTDVETHTVETHIYRLRKKILNSFNDNGFISSEKNGYQIKKKPNSKRSIY